MGDKLLVALNSDIWLKTKKFLPSKESNFETTMIDEVIEFEDDEHGGCINANCNKREIYV